MTLSCPTCDSTDLALDYDGVVTISIKDGTLHSVTVGGVIDVLPDGLFCRGCDTVIRPLHEQAAGFADQAATVVDEVVTETDPVLRNQLSGGFALYERS